MNEPTHVAAWIPGYQSCDGSGFWQLTTIAVFDAIEADTLGDLADDEIWTTTGLPADPAALGHAVLAWAAEKLARPVRVYPGRRMVRKHRFSLPRSEPLFWVHPGGG